MRILIKFFLLFLILFNILPAQTMKWDGELRVRSELDNRDFNNSTPPNYFTLLRARLGAEISPIENLKFYFQVQDSRIFGEERDARNNFNTVSNTKNLDLHQAYIQVDKFLVDGLTLKVGRQRLTYANERFVGVVGWNNIGRVFDGGLIRYEVDKHKLDVFLMNTAETNVVPSAATPTEVKFVRDEGQLFSGFNFSTKYFSDHLWEIFTYHQLDKRVTVPGYNDLSRFTSGLYGKGRLSNQLSYETDVAYQYGWRQGKDISAYMFGLTLSYSFERSILSSLSISLERFSGTKTSETKYKTFELPYPTGHKFFGYMDYFINIPLHTDGKGIQDIFARLDFKLSDNVKANIIAHNFNLSEYLDGENKVGQELDIVLNWKYNSYLNFEIGGGLFLPGKFMQKKFNSYDVSQWGYFTTMLMF